MKRFALLLAAGLVSAACSTAIPRPAVAADQPNIIVMGLDQDRDTIPSLNRVYTRVVNALVNQMHDEGFNVFDETRLTMDSHTLDISKRKTNRLVIDIVRSIDGVPLDVVVLFKIYPKSKRMSTTQKIGARIEGRLLNIHSGQRLGNFEVASPKMISVALDCDRECLLERLGDEAKILAQHVGAVLVAKLDGLTVQSMKSDSTASSSGKGGLPQQYELTFNNFTDTDINDIEEYIVAFSGYDHHRPIRAQARHARYWYESRSDRARIIRNLRKMLEHMDTNGTVTFTSNKILVEKIAARKKRN
jgi:hypothetical protein